MRNYPKVTITEKGEKALLSGHPWVFADEVLSVSQEYENGMLVDVLGTKGRYRGTGYINGNSKIRIRIISQNANDLFDEEFYRRRIRYALNYRKTVMGKDFSSCRLIFGEADSFPGLTVDKFEDVLVTEVLSLGTEKVKDVIYKLLVEELAKDGIRVRALYERNDSKLRVLEGMEQYNGYYSLEGVSNDINKVIITENGVKYNVDFINGQKTGFFLDQKYNRKAVARLAEGKNVLDCFTHTGAFALNAALGGAKSVTAVDISKAAIEMTMENVKLNGMEKVFSYVCDDVFQYLSHLEATGKKPFDFIILDPPAFTKSSQTTLNAKAGYKFINYKALKLLPRGGYFATCSCSHFMEDKLFRKMLKEASELACVSLRQIEGRQQGPDHPILWNVPETDYLKFYIFQVI